MSLAIAKHLYENGRSHGLASDLLYRSAIEEGHRLNASDPEHFAFNGPYSLSIHYLICLGFELMLKAALVASGGPSDERSLRAIGHDLMRLLDSAEESGFHSKAPRLREIVQHLNTPFKDHSFRYRRPNDMALPDFSQMVEALEVLDNELSALCQIHDVQPANP